MKIIEVKNLKKSYGKITALKGIDVYVDRGEFFGLLGPNGAGKTTTINILSTILKPDEGEVYINGHSMYDHPKQCKKFIGIVPQELALYEELSAMENLIFWGRLYGISQSEAETEAKKLLGLFELDSRSRSLIKSFSGGMKRRINMAAAMMHQPEILLMDEPTVGVDPQSRHKIYDVLAEIAYQGVTIIYTTHYMDEVEKICNRIGIIDHGQIIASGTLDELRQITGSTETIIIHFEPSGTENNHCQKLKSEFGNPIAVENDKLVYTTDNSSRDLPLLIDRCSKLCSAITHIAVERASLENVFLKLTGRKLRD
ncbi:MAG: ABC transporter ATP-binding protein [Bacteroidales bacterium]